MRPVATVVSLIAEEIISSVNDIVGLQSLSTCPTHGKKLVRLDGHPVINYNKLTAEPPSFECY
jgi:hypothetical protein